MIDVPPGAVWIGSPHPFDLNEVYIRFRRSFELHDPPNRAILSVTADSRYKLWVNGVFVARGPRRCYPQAQSVDEIDITDHLSSGVNVLAVLVYQPGYSHFAYVHRGSAGLLCWLAQDTQILLATDNVWRAQRDNSFSAAVPRVSIYGSGMEDRDWRQVEPWQQPEYDDRQWPVARIVAPAHGDPWLGLERRELPLLSEGERPLTLLAVRQTAGPNAPSYAKEEMPAFQLHEALARGWGVGTARPAPAAGALAGEAGWHGLDQQTGVTTYWLFDLGRDYPCLGRVNVIGASGGETLLVSYLETLVESEPLFSDPDTYCRMRLTDRFTLRAGDQIVESFALRGGRYILFAVQGQTRAQIAFGCGSTGYPLQRSRQLLTDDRELQAIITLCETTFDACLQDGFVDSVWRESSQWVGDALVQGLILHSMSDDPAPLRQVIRMAAQGAYPDGVLPGVVPGEVHAYTVVDYNFSWVELLALYHSSTADTAFVHDHKAVLARLLQRFSIDIGPDGLIRSQPGRRLFLDWAPVSREEPNATYNLRFLLALQTATEMARDLGWAEHSEAWRQQAEQLGQAIRDAFWRAGRWQDDLAGNTHSQLATALAVLTGLAREDETPALLDAVVSRSLDPIDDHDPGGLVLASPFMHHYIFEALVRHGRYADVVEIVRRRWGRWAAAGWPTAWENWNVDFPDGSLCHAFSAHPRYHLWKIAELQVLPSGAAGQRSAFERRGEGSVAFQVL